jgi:hypothetical protein
MIFEFFSLLTMQPNEGVSDEEEEEEAKASLVCFNAPLIRP